jgi:hypothetical protein
VEHHIYAVVGYDPYSSQPFKVYNPWGTNSSGWALLTNHGQQVWGLFNANAAFLTQNFTAYTVVAATGVQANSAIFVRATADGLIPSLANLPSAGFHRERSLSRAFWDAVWAEASAAKRHGSPVTLAEESWFCTGLEGK